MAKDRSSRRHRLRATAPDPPEFSLSAHAGADASATRDSDHRRSRDASTAAPERRRSHPLSSPSAAVFPPELSLSEPRSPEAVATDGSGSRGSRLLRSLLAATVSPELRRSAAVLPPELSLSAHAGADAVASASRGSDHRRSRVASTATPERRRSHLQSSPSAAAVSSELALSDPQSPQAVATDRSGSGSSRHGRSLPAATGSPELRRSAAAGLPPEFALSDSVRSEDVATDRSASHDSRGRGSRAAADDSPEIRLSNPPPDSASAEDSTTVTRKPAVRVLLSSAEGQIAHALMFLIARGNMLGPDQPVILHLITRKEAVDNLTILKQDLVDTALPLLEGIVTTANMAEGWKDVDIAVLLDDSESHIKEMVNEDTAFYKSQAHSLQSYAAANCKVLLIHAETSFLETLNLDSKEKKYRHLFPMENISWLTRMLQNAEAGRVSGILDVPVEGVRNVIVWGEPSELHPDVGHATYKKSGKEILLPGHAKNMLGENSDKKSAASIIGILNPMSIASSAIDHIHDWVLGTPKGTWVSMGLCSNGSYSVPMGQYYSYPVTCSDGRWQIVTGLPHKQKRLETDALTRINVSNAPATYVSLYGIKETDDGHGYADDNVWMKCEACHMYWQSTKTRCTECGGRLTELDTGPEDDEGADYLPEAKQKEYRVSCDMCEWTHQFFTDKKHKCMECGYVMGADQGLGEDESEHGSSARRGGSDSSASSIDYHNSDKRKKRRYED